MPTDAELHATQRQNIADGWRTDWGPLIEHTMEDTGLPRLEAMMLYFLMNVAQLGRLLDKDKHPEFKEDCAHCQRQRKQDALYEENVLTTTRYQEKALPYLERALKYMDEDHEADDWKPGPI